MRFRLRYSLMAVRLCNVLKYNRNTTLCVIRGPHACQWIPVPHTRMTVCVCVSLAACQQSHNAARNKPIRANMAYTDGRRYNHISDWCLQAVPLLTLLVPSLTLSLVPFQNTDISKHGVFTRDYLPLKRLLSQRICLTLIRQSCLPLLPVAIWGAGHQGWKVTAVWDAGRSLGKCKGQGGGGTGGGGGR